MPRLCCLLLLVPVLALAATSRAELPGFDGGHLKGFWQTSTFPDDSLFRPLAGAVAHDQTVDGRLRFAHREGGFSAQLDYQLIGRFGDTLALGQAFGDALLPNGVLSDDRRWFDLTHVIDESDNRIAVQRLDRAHIGWTGSKAVLRFGRQAVSWGNGLFYNPMDMFNPFDPAAIDTEFKPGDDMLYGQYLLDSGSDWQFVSVQRRDAAGDVGAEVASNALKFHHFGNSREVDALVAQHFDDTVLALGGVANWGGAVLRADVVLTETPDEWLASAVANWSYSLMLGGRNVSVLAELFYNGFGQQQGEYGVAQLADNQPLLQRLNRGEVFTLGRYYLASSMTVEWTPLLNLQPTLFWNLADGSALAQLLARWDVAQDVQVLLALNLPLGPSGTEFGGIDSGVPGLQLSRGPAAFAQLAWYF